MQCQNHLKQIGLAFHNHHDTFQHLPTGGWGWGWVGDPDSGHGDHAAGRLGFQRSFPLSSRKALYDIAAGKTGQPKQADLAKMVGTPVKFYNCPSRRPGTLYPVTVQPLNSAAVTMGAKIDYAVNAGDQVADERNGGTATPEVITNLTYTGICFVRSKVRLRKSPMARRIR